MSVGLGFSAAGFSPAGSGDVDEGVVASGNLLVDAQGVRQGARMIDPQSRQYVLNDDGSAQGMIPSRQLVQIAIQTVKDSSCLSGFGKRATGGVVNERTAKQVRLDIEDALSALVQGRTIQLLSVEVQRPTPTRITAVVRWLDLATNIEQATEI